MWQTGEVIVSRGIYRNKVWSAVPTIVVSDRLGELILAVLAGAECFVEETYAKGKNTANRLWDFKEKDWKLAPFLWHTSRLLILHEPDKFYSTRLFWQANNNRFEGYYINFELPYKRSHCGIDTRDLELDLDIEPNLSFHWKDVEDYQKAIDCGLILPEWVGAIEEQTPAILQRLRKREYPFDGSWVDWLPGPNWSPPKLPANWEHI